MQYPKKSIENFHVCNQIDTCLEHLKRPENHYMAVGGSKLQILNSQAYSPSKHYCFGDSESILTYHVSLLLKKNTKMEMRINKIIRRTFEAGLFVKWGRDYKYKHEEELLVPTGQMTMSNALTAVVFGLGVGLPIALLVFLFELIVAFKIKQPNPSKFWLYGHMMCSPDRIFFKLKTFQ